MRTLRYLLPATALALASCTGNKDAPPLVGSRASVANSGTADAMFQEAQAAESAGKAGKAAKIYGKLAEEMPVANRAPEARFRQAELLRQTGDVKGSFDAYQEFLTRYNSSNLYQKALDAQASMAQAAADGQVKTSFLGLKSKLGNEKIADMLTKVRQNAPRSPTAAKAQFTLGKVWESEASDTGTVKAIAAYRELSAEYPDSPQAPEGQFLIGKILLDQARRGNHDQANLDRAKEAFQDYLRRYPNHSRTGEARKLLANLGGQDIQRSFEIAQFYEKKGDYGSAKFYYQEVMNKAKSGPLYDQSKARLAALGGH